MGVKPPIGTLPLPTEVMQPVEGRALARVTPPVTCPGGIDENGQPVDCVDRRPVPTAATGGFGSAVPITPGREFAEQSLWNTWADARHVGSTDHRYGLDNKGRGNYLTLGADRRISNDFVAGVSLSVEDNSSTGFGGASQVDSNGVNIGPYIGMRLSDAWAMDASLGFGRIENDNQIAVLKGRYTAQRYSAAVNLTGQYAVGEMQWRPKVSVSYTHLRNEAYQMSGVVIGIPVTLQNAENKFNYGVTEATLEVNKIISLSEGKIVVPYAEFGARYEFDRPNGGQMLAFDLTLATPSAWTGSLRLGARALVTRATSFEASLGYLSIGQKGLDVMEARLFLSHAF